MGKSPVLAQGQVIRLSRSGAHGIVGPMIGSGGQGGVYVFDAGGRRLALKWYHPHVVRQDAAARERIARLIDIGPPDDRFLWPLDLAEAADREGFGYVMPLMSGDRRQLKDIIAEPPDRVDMTLDARAFACFQIAESFQQLHARGLCYQDVNLGGFFVDPIRGSILICDADNISVDGSLGGVYGTRKFMAPEVALRQAIPSTRTDLYSMAVLFFYIIFGWHPLDGRREAEMSFLDAAAERRLYASDPLFIFDPDRTENGPLAGFHDWIVARWAVLPHGLKVLFLKSFTTGLRDAQSGRVVESEWRRAFARLRDAVARCAGCAFELAVAIEIQDLALLCAACGHAVPKPTRMAIANYLVVFLPGREIYRHHVEPDVPVDLAHLVGRVEEHPRDTSILGLKNLSDRPWMARSADGQALTIAPARTVRIEHGLTVDFGNRRGVIWKNDSCDGVAG